ncbi:MAG: hypothetical protein SGARI_006193 [Bacillariaceae sp.]
MGTEPLQKVEFGPTHIQLISDDVLRKYAAMRYKRKAFCDFPFDQNHDDKNSTKKAEGDLPARASQMRFALSKWYIPLRNRAEWLQQVGKRTGNTVTHTLLPNLDEVEVDNSIAPPEACQMGAPGRPIRVVNFNAERGRYWREHCDIE